MRWLFSSNARHGTRPTSLPTRVAAAPADPAVERVLLAMASAVLGTLDACDAEGGLAEHCARVAALAARLAEACAVPAADARLLERAARLHEVGRIGLAPRGACGDERTLDGVRAHAAVGAHIVRRTEGELAGWLVEQQYADYEALRLRVAPADSRLLLAGILRVADVADVLEPRPGCAAGGADWAHTVLAGGRGTRFHPAAVDAWTRLRAQAFAGR